MVLIFCALFCLTIGTFFQREVRYTSGYSSYAVSTVVSLSGSVTAFCGPMQLYHILYMMKRAVYSLAFSTFSRNQLYASTTPSSNSILCFQPREWSLVTSVSFLGVPSGISLFQIISPSNPTVF